MDDHAKAVASRWAAKLPAAVADGMSEADFFRHFERFLLWGGWSAATAEKIIARAKQINERRKQNANETKNL